MNQGFFFFFNGCGDGNKNDREVTSKNSFLLGSNENIGKIVRITFF